MRATIHFTESGCWVWESGRTSSGYGKGRWQGTIVQAHRVLYEQMHGVIPAGHHLHHTCETPACVRPDHLEPLTPLEHAHRHYGDGPFRADACVNGHAYTEANTYIKPNGGRVCRICVCAASARYRARLEGATT